jgi:hypothetical protein
MTEEDKKQAIKYQNAAEFFARQVMQARDAGDFERAKNLQEHSKTASMLVRICLKI